MKIVIDISESMLDELRTCKFPIQDAYRLCAVIENGTPLPKGHERIVDLGKVENIVCDEFVDLQDGSEEWRTAVNDAVENILHKVHDLHTIVEADKENE